MLSVSFFIFISYGKIKTVLYINFYAYLFLFDGSPTRGQGVDGGANADCSVASPSSRDPFY